MLFQSSNVPLGYTLKSQLDIVYEISSKQEDVAVIQGQIALVDKKVDGALDIKSLIPVAIMWIVSFIVVLKIFQGKLFIVALILSAVIAFFLQVLIKVPKIKKAEAYEQAVMPGLKGKLQQTAQELAVLIPSDRAQLITKTIPADYATVDAISFFITALQNQRADNLKEAINLYENEKHNREMLEMQQAEMTLLAESVRLNQAQLNMQKDSLKGQEQLILQNKKLSKQVRFSNAIGIINTAKHWKSK